MRNAELNGRPVGVHVSIAGRLQNAVDRAIEVGCNRTFQIFTCSPQRWAANPIVDQDAEQFREKVIRNDFVPFCHMPYLPNFCSPDQTVYSQSTKVLIREVKRCAQLGIRSLVLHFGSHVGTSVADGHRRLVDACVACLRETSGLNVRLLLENSAGIKNSVGSDFNYIRGVLDRIGNEDRTGVCFDTCHAFASGYDLSSEKAVVETMDEFDSVVGAEKLKLIHLNDSKAELGGASDRHENIGQGKIGMAGLKALLGLKRYAAVPIILETPIRREGDDKMNLEAAKSLLRRR